MQVLRRPSETATLTDIFNNVGPVKSFVSVFLPSLRRVVRSASIGRFIDDQGSRVI